MDSALRVLLDCSVGAFVEQRFALWWVFNGAFSGNRIDVRERADAALVDVLVFPLPVDVGHMIRRKHSRSVLFLVRLDSEMVVGHMAASFLGVGFRSPFPVFPATQFKERRRLAKVLSGLFVPRCFLGNT